MEEKDESISMINEYSSMSDTALLEKLEMVERKSGILNNSQGAKKVVL